MGTEYLLVDETGKNVLDVHKWYAGAHASGSYERKDDSDVIHGGDETSCTDYDYIDGGPGNDSVSAGDGNDILW